MKIFFSAIIVCLCSAVCAQCLCSAEYMRNTFLSLEPVQGELNDDRGTMTALNGSAQVNNQVPPPPVLTSGSSQLEICTGRNTTLTASSDYNIDWYATPPPLGTPIGRGSYFVTPTLTTGYYTFYAIATDGQTNSNVSAMEVVMVYPLPTVTVSSSSDVLCAGGSVVLTARGTSFYHWGNDLHTPSIVISPTVSTTYMVIGTSMAGCMSSFSFTQRVEDCTSIAEQKEADQKTNNQTSVYPNPAQGEFNIAVNNISENTKVEIYNSLGELVNRTRIRTELTPLTLKNLPDGIYIVIISENTKVLSQHKLIKE